jgi:hypothetical protein
VFGGKLVSISDEPLNSVLELPTGVVSLETGFPMKNSGLELSAFLIAVGAILAFAVTYEAESIDLNQVGIILLVVGVGVGVVTLITAAAGQRTTINTQREAIVDGQPTVENQRETIVERERI